MNTQAILPLDELLKAYAGSQFMLTRRDVVDYDGVRTFVENARSKALNDYNIASLIQVQTPSGYVPAIILSKSHAAAGATTASAVAVYTNNINHTGKYVNAITRNRQYRIPV